MQLTLPVFALVSAGSLLLANSPDTSLVKAREGFETKLTSQVFEKEKPVKPPEGITLVRYEAPTGEANAYITDAPSKDGPHPAIIWITGGFPSGGASDTAFEPGDVDNDQSGFQFRQEGVITLYPSLRGSFGVPGLQEAFLGEVDDVLAALKYLRSRDDVDPGRIFLGGHSTGGTLALLVSEVPNEFRAVFSYGPCARASEYASKYLPFDRKNEAEDLVRSPIHHLDDIETPTFVFEGEGDPNAESLAEMRDATKNRSIKWAIISDADHFAYLRPLNSTLARAIASDDGKGTFSVDPKECAKSATDFIGAQLDATTIRAIASARSRGIELKQTQPFTFRAWSRRKADIDSLKGSKEANKFDLNDAGAQGDKDNRWYLLEVRAKAKPSDLARCCKLSADIHAWVRSHDADITRFYVETPE